VSFGCDSIEVIKTYSIIDLTEEEKDVLVSTIRSKYINMSNESKAYAILHKILLGLK
jgi:hypothetical protein